MRDPRHISKEIQQAESLLVTANKRYNSALRAEMYSNESSFDSLDALTDMNVLKNTLVELKTELSSALPIRD